MPAAGEGRGSGDVQRVTAVSAGDALARLRTVSSNTLLTERIPIELSEAGFGAVAFYPIDLPAAAAPGHAWPVYIWQAPVALLHTVDARPGNDDVLATFAEGIGAILERNIALAQLRTIHVAARGHSWEIGSLIEPFGGVSSQHGSPVVASELLTRPLTPRQQQVLRLLASGDTNAQMADRLSITKATVQHHVRHIIRKLGGRDRTDAVTASMAWLGETPAD